MTIMGRLLRPVLLSEPVPDNSGTTGTCSLIEDATINDDSQQGSLDDLFDATALSDP